MSTKYNCRRNWAVVRNGVHAIDKFLLGPLFYYLTAETFLDCVCFSLLLASNYEVHQDQGIKQGKRR